MKSSVNYKNHEEFSCRKLGRRPETSWTWSRAWLEDSARGRLVGMANNLAAPSSNSPPVLFPHPSSCSLDREGPLERVSSVHKSSSKRAVLAPGRRTPDKESISA